jgi:NAD(P)-dependent dehydrogenase (short-subunit alcohol dehydrogenase family)
MAGLCNHRLSRIATQNSHTHIRCYSSNRLRGRVAIITGSSSGLGRAIALRYAAEGARVVCADLQPEVTKHDTIDTATHDLIAEKGGRSMFVSTNVGDEVSVQNLIKSAAQEFGKVDMYVDKISNA